MSSHQPEGATSFLSIETKPKLCLPVSGQKSSLDCKHNEDGLHQNQNWLTLTGQAPVERQKQKSQLHLLRETIEYLKQYRPECVSELQPKAQIVLFLDHQNMTSFIGKQGFLDHYLIKDKKLWLYIFYCKNDAKKLSKYLKRGNYPNIVLSEAPSLRNGADTMIVVQMSKLHCILPLCVDFRVISGDNSFIYFEHQLLSKGRQMEVISPHPTGDKTFQDILNRIFREHMDLPQEIRPLNSQLFEIIDEALSSDAKQIHFKNKPEGNLIEEDFFLIGFGATSADCNDHSDSVLSDTGNSTLAQPTSEEDGVISLLNKTNKDESQVSEKQHLLNKKGDVRELVQCFIASMLDKYLPPSVSFVFETPDLREKIKQSCSQKVLPSMVVNEEIRLVNTGSQERLFLQKGEIASKKPELLMTGEANLLHEDIEKDTSELVQPSYDSVQSNKKPFPSKRQSANIISSEKLENVSLESFRRKPSRENQEKKDMDKAQTLHVSRNRWEREKQGKCADSLDWRAKYMSDEDKEIKQRGRDTGRRRVDSDSHAAHTYQYVPKGRSDESRYCGPRSDKADLRKAIVPYKEEPRRCNWKSFKKRETLETGADSSNWRATLKKY